MGNFYRFFGNFCRAGHNNRTDSGRVLNVLRTFDVWQKFGWTTLKVKKLPSGDVNVEIDQESSEPHTIDHTWLNRFPGQLFDFLSLKRHRISDRVFHVDLEVDGGSIPCICKIAKFGFETVYLETEFQAYYHLHCIKSPLITKFHGYVYEVTSERIISFVMEYIAGRHPNRTDSNLCRAALNLLHNENVIHGDPNIFNIIINKDEKVKLIDFEGSTIADDEELKKSAETDFEKLQAVFGG